MPNGTAKHRSVGTNLTAATSNTIYTCPANYTSKVELLHVVNNTSGAKKIDVAWYDASAGESYHITASYSINSYSYFMLVDGYLVMNAGDYITCTPEAGADMSAIVSAEEKYDPMSNN
jgi:hypothetical protein